jgi:uncharacterized membrane protein YdbT with pleckstrin-like domain
MPDPQDNTAENVHTMRASVFVLIVKSAIAWLIIAFAYLVAAMFISDFHSLQLFIFFWPSATILLFILLLYGVLVLYVTLDWNSRYYTINGKGVIVHEGVIFSKAIQYDMAAIESVALEQGLFGKLFNFGTLEFYNPHLHLTQKLKIHDIPNPHKEAQFIEHLHPNPVSFISAGS